MKKIGIVGLGLVGKSYLVFFKDKKQISTWDEKNNPSQISISQFLKSNNLNFISPGIPYKKYLDFYKNNKNKCLGELDLLAKHFAKPTICVTGSLGKTTVCRLLETFLRKNKLNVGLAGNIGRPMLDLITEQEKIDLAVLELSSFQLFLNKKFASDIAIWTNFYPNHLNWHETEKHYFDSKFKIFQFQTKYQYSIFPINLIKPGNFEQFKKLKSMLCIVCDESFDPNKHFLLLGEYLLFCVEANVLRCLKIQENKIIEKEDLFDLSSLPDFSFVQNWIYALIAIYLYGVDLQKLKINKKDFDLNEAVFEHRLEYFTTINGVDFYNDSKSTVIQASATALKKLNKNGKPVILILGGLSKGVDRTEFIQSLSSRYKNLKGILFFGAESNLFKNIKTYRNLEYVLDEIKKIAKPGDQVLFSPSGSSFDLFENYIHRGKAFKDLVLREKVNGNNSEQVKK